MTRVHIVHIMISIAVVAAGAAGSPTAMAAPPDNLCPAKPPMCDGFDISNVKYVDTGTQLLGTGDLSCLDRKEIAWIHLHSRGMVEITCDGESQFVENITVDAYQSIEKRDIKLTCADFKLLTPEPTVPNICPVGQAQEIVDMRFQHIRLTAWQEGGQDYERDCYYPEFEGSDDGPITTLDCDQ